VHRQCSHDRSGCSETGRKRDYQISTDEPICKLIGGIKMPFFVFVCLAVIACSFLIMLAVQIIRMEKALIEISEITESMVKKFYGNT
jgi:hypothetical protein